MKKNIGSADQLVPIPLSLYNSNAIFRRLHQWHTTSNPFYPIGSHFIEWLLSFIPFFQMEYQQKAEGRRIKVVS